MRGVLRMTFFKDVFVVSGSGVGGGSLGYANTLYRARDAFFQDPRWRDLADWKAELASHYDTAERMLGVTDVRFDSDGDILLRELAWASSRPMATRAWASISVSPTLSTPIRISTVRVRPAQAASVAASAWSAAAMEPRTRS
jgi:hypothetical protein